MRHKTITVSFKKIASAVILVITSVFCGTHIFAASNVKMTIYQNGKAPQVFNLSSIRNVTFGSIAGSRPDAIKKIVHSVKMLPSRNCFKLDISGAPGTCAQLRIFNISGREILFRKFVLGNDGSGIMTVPDITNGLFIVQMKNGTSTIIQRINVAR